MAQSASTQTIKGTSMTASIPSENPTWHVPNSQAGWTRIPNVFQVHRMASQNPRHHLHQQHQQRRVQWNRYGRCVRPVVNWVSHVSEFWSMHAVGGAVGSSPIPAFTQAVPFYSLEARLYACLRYRIKHQLHHAFSNRTSMDRAGGGGVVCM